jgi:bacterioferritin-associated ferredoxin
LNGALPTVRGLSMSREFGGPTNAYADPTDPFTPREASAGARSVHLFDDGVGRHRELHIIEVPGERRRPAWRIFSAVARGGGMDLGAPCARVREGRPVTTSALKRFQKLGYLVGNTGANAGNIACRCLGLSVEDVRRAARAHGTSFEALGAVTGVGAICGGCARSVEEAESLSVAGSQPHRDP